MDKATEKLREMLDERGVEWEKPLGIMSQIKTVWRVGPWEYTAIETSGGEFSIYIESRYWLTHEQAIAAMLGLGECHDCLGDTEPFECNECHHRSGQIKFPNYCWFCGRKVVIR